MKRRTHKQCISKRFMLRDIPLEVHRAFKTKCAKEGRVMNQRIIELMEADIKQGTNPKEK